MDKKVTLVTPCYNGGKYLSRYLDCVIAQDYDNIELILINDGSTDKTHDIFCSYIPKLKKRNIEIKYIQQENQGAAGAMNSGIKQITGDYLAWPDSDDILLPNFISSRVATLEQHPNAAILVCPVEIVDEDDTSRVISRSAININWDENNEKSIYFNILRLQGLLVFPGSFMIKTTHFKNANPFLNFPYKREIGQNYQMLLPVCYKYKACFCPTVSFRYVIRSDSHSHSQKSKEESIHKYEVARKLLYELLDIIPFENEEDRKKTILCIEWRFNHWMLDIGIQYNDDKLYQTYYDIARTIEQLEWNYRKTYWMFKYPYIKPLFGIASKMKHLLS